MLAHRQDEAGKRPAVQINLTVKFLYRHNNKIRTRTAKSNSMDNSRLILQNMRIIFVAIAY